MTIFYFINIRKKQNSGGGGSHYSSASVAKAMSSNHNTFYFVVGDIESVAVKNVLENDYIFLSTKNLLKKIISLFTYFFYLFKYRPHIVHLFNRKIIFFGYLGRIFSNSKIILTKCGGQNVEKNFFYLPKNLLTISKENFNFYQNNKVSYGIINLGYIPNRILPFPQDKSLIKKLKKHINYNEKDTIVLRVGRIHEYYKIGIGQSVNFYNNLKKDKKNNVKLVLIGYQYGPDFLGDEVKNDPNIFILEDQTFTSNPKSLVMLADYKIGNGRCVMEYCSVGGRILVPTYKHGIIELNKSNIYQALSYNFSERIELNPEGKYVDNFKEPNDDHLFLKEFFDSNFNARNALNKFEDFYNNSVQEDVSLKDLLKSFLIFYNY